MTSKQNPLTSDYDPHHEDEEPAPRRAGASASSGGLLIDDDGIVHELAGYQLVAPEGRMT